MTPTINQRRQPLVRPASIQTHFAMIETTSQIIICRHKIGHFTGQILLKITINITGNVKIYIIGNVLQFMIG